MHGMFLNVKDVGCEMPFFVSGTGIHVVLITDMNLESVFFISFGRNVVFFWLINKFRV